MIDYLPLGSIVLLKNGVQKALIISRAINVRNGDKDFFFDYGGLYAKWLCCRQICAIWMCGKNQCHC